MTTSDVHCSGPEAPRGGWLLRRRRAPRAAGRAPASAAGRALVALALLVGATGCGGDEGVDADGIRSAVTTLDADLDRVSARATAEQLRLAIGLDRRADDVGARDVEVILENAADLPSKPTVHGLQDADDDGLDDDGLVFVQVGDAVVCLSLSADSDDVTVVDGSC